LKNRKRKQEIREEKGRRKTRSRRKIEMEHEI